MGRWRRWRGVADWVLEGQVGRRERGRADGEERKGKGRWGGEGGEGQMERKGRDVADWTWKGQVGRGVN